MKIKYNCEKAANHMEIENYLSAFEYDLGKKVIVDGYAFDNGIDFKVLLTSVENEKAYSFVVTKSIECDNYGKVRIIDENNQFVEYHGKICNKYFRRYSKYNGFINNNIYFIKGLTINTDDNNFYSYILEDGEKESHISILNCHNLFDILKDIKNIDLIDIFKFLQEKNPKLTNNILIITIDSNTNTKKGIKIEDGKLVKFEKQYKNSNDAWAILTHNGDDITVSIYGELDENDTENSKNDLEVEFEKIKSLRK